MCGASCAQCHGKPCTCVGVGAGSNAGESPAEKAKRLAGEELLRKQKEEAERKLREQQQQSTVPTEADRQKVIQHQSLLNQKQGLLSAEQRAVVKRLNLSLEKEEDQWDLAKCDVAQIRALIQALLRLIPPEPSNLPPAGGELSVVSSESEEQLTSCADISAADSCRGASIGEVACAWTGPLNKCMAKTDITCTHLRSDNIADDIALCQSEELSEFNCGWTGATCMAKSEITCTHLASTVCQSDEFSEKNCGWTGDGNKCMDKAQITCAHLSNEVCLSEDLSQAVGLVCGWTGDAQRCMVKSEITCAHLDMELCLYILIRQDLREFTGITQGDCHWNEVDGSCSDPTPPPPPPPQQPQGNQDNAVVQPVQPDTPWLDAVHRGQQVDLARQQEQERARAELARQQADQRARAARLRQQRAEQERQRLAEQRERERQTAEQQRGGEQTTQVTPTTTQPAPVQVPVVVRAPPPVTNGSEGRIRTASSETETRGLGSMNDFNQRFAPPTGRSSPGVFASTRSLFPAVPPQTVTSLVPTTTGRSADGLRERSTNHGPSPTMMGAMHSAQSDTMVPVGPKPMPNALSREELMRIRQDVISYFGIEDEDLARVNHAVVVIRWFLKRFVIPRIREIMRQANHVQLPAVRILPRAGVNIVQNPGSAMVLPTQQAREFNEVVRAHLFDVDQRQPRGEPSPSHRRIGATTQSHTNSPVTARRSPQPLRARDDNLPPLRTTKTANGRPVKTKVDQYWDESPHFMPVKAEQSALDMMDSDPLDLNENSEPHVVFPKPQQPSAGFVAQLSQGRTFFVASNDCPSPGSSTASDGFNGTVLGELQKSLTVDGVPADLRKDMANAVSPISVVALGDHLLATQSPKSAPKIEHQAVVAAVVARVTHDVVPGFINAGGMRAFTKRVTNGPFCLPCGQHPVSEARTETKVEAETSVVIHGKVHTQLERETAPLERRDRNMGCPHYVRQCSIIPSCCNKKYACRLCHDADPDRSCKSTLDGNTSELVKQIECNHCGMRQSPSNQCQNPACKREFAEYYCKSCKLWEGVATATKSAGPDGFVYGDQAAEVDLWHCDKCNKCRRGRREAQFHCAQCNTCADLVHEKIANPDEDTLRIPVDVILDPKDAYALLFPIGEPQHFQVPLCTVELPRSHVFRLLLWLKAELKKKRKLKSYIQ